jgi:hypothetical protein
MTAAVGNLAGNLAAVNSAAADLEKGVGTLEPVGNHADGRARAWQGRSVGESVGARRGRADGEGVGARQGRAVGEGVRAGEDVGARPGRAVGVGITGK